MPRSTLCGLAGALRLDRTQVRHAWGMELDELLGQFDIAAANPARMDKVWERASALIPEDMVFGSLPEYDELIRQWDDLASALPLINGSAFSNRLIDLNELAQWRFDAHEMGAVSAHVDAVEAASEPQRALDRVSSQASPSSSARSQYPCRRVDGSHRRDRG